MMINGRQKVVQVATAQIVKPDTLKGYIPSEFPEPAVREDAAQRI